MFNLDFLEKDLGKFLHYILCMNFQKKCFSCYIILTDKILLPDCLYFLSNMCIAVACFPDCGVINFEVNLIFLIKRFFYMTKKTRFAKNFLRPENAASRKRFSKQNFQF